MSDWEVTSFPAMGTTAVVQLRGCDAQRRLDEVRALLRRLERSWSRFDPQSELSRLNADPATAVEVSDDLALAIAAALYAARRSDGLVVPTLGGAVAAAGYDRTWTALERLGTGAALAAVSARPSRPARGTSAWQDVALDGCTVHRPPGLRLDLGGIGKGLAADLAVALLADAEHAMVSVGGDLATGGRDADTVAQRVVAGGIDDGEPLGELLLHRGGAATSGVTRRAFRRPDGTPTHHLLDPSDGLPATTGVVQVTALGSSGCDAERRAKQALLLGPGRMEDVLREHGGLALLADGQVVGVEARR